MADRMRKSLREAHLNVATMADYLDVSRNTVGNWINGHTRPPGAALRLWAMRCGVKFEWLRDGIDTPGPTPGGGATNVGLLPAHARWKIVRGFRSTSRQPQWALSVAAA